LTKENEHLIFLVRHGATWENEHGICQGSRVDPQLSPNGKIQAMQLGMFLRAYCQNKNIQFPTLIVSSHLKRARETASILSSHCFPPQHICTHGVANDLGELNHGTWDGKTWDEIRKEFPEEYRQYNEEYLMMRYPNGESVSEGFVRIIPTFQKLLSWWPDGNIIIAAHGGTNHIIISTILQTRNLQSFRQSNTGLTIISHRPNHIIPFCIDVLNSTAHLV